MQVASTPPSSLSPQSQLAAEKACEHWGEGKDCVFDVLTTGDPEMAVWWAPTRLRSGLHERAFMFYSMTIES
jgi:hypothetical protein